MRIKKFLLIIVFLILNINCTEKKTEKINIKNQDIKDIKYEILKEVYPDKNSNIQKKNISILIPCNITKEEMYSQIIPKLVGHVENYNGLWISFYCDKRFYEISQLTNGSAEIYKDGTIAVDSIKLHENSLTEKEIGVYTEYQSKMGKVKPSSNETKEKEDIKNTILKKYNITEEEFDKIWSKVWSYIL